MPFVVSLYHRIKRQVNRKIIAEAIKKRTVILDQECGCSFIIP